MWLGKFDPAGRTVWVDVQVYGPLGSRRALFVVDTGSQSSVISNEVTDALGYGAHMGTTINHVLGVGGRDSGYRLPVHRIEMMGLDLIDFEIACHDMPEDVGGLIGMDLIEGRVLMIDAKMGVVSFSD
mgnify:CR=1 FL=1